MVSKAIATKKSTAVANIQEMLKKQAAEMKDRVGNSGGNKIKITTDKTFDFPDGRTEEGPIELVVVDFINRQIFYEDGYVAGEISQPTCWAISTVIKDLKPSNLAPAPEGTNCASCPMNQWGTDGKGKACKMNRKLVVVDPYAEEPALMTIEVNKKSADLFDSYVHSITAKYELPPIAVVTKLSFSPKDSFPIVNFADGGINQNLEVHFGMQSQAKPILEVEFESVEEEVSKKTAPVRRKKRAVRK